MYNDISKDTTTQDKTKHMVPTKRQLLSRAITLETGAHYKPISDFPICWNAGLSIRLIGHRELAIPLYYTARYGGREGSGNLRFIRENLRFVRENLRFVRENLRFVREILRFVRENLRFVRENLGFF